MRAAARLILLGAFGGLALGACGQRAANEIAANDSQKVDIEALPVDESDATPTNDLANGDDETDVNALDGNDAQD